MSRDTGRVPIYRALVQPNLLMGGERTLVLFSLFLCAMLIFFALLASWYILFIISPILGIVLIGLIREMGSSDPLMSSVYLKHVQKYQTYYPPYDSVWRER